jgi:predicted ATPase
LLTLASQSSLSPFLNEGGIVPTSSIRLSGSSSEVSGSSAQVSGASSGDQAIERCEQTNERWLFAELLRLKGELMLCKESAAAKAEDNLREALDWARRQGALLRAATSLVRLLRKQGEHGDAVACLQPVYNRFIEGFDTAYLVTARNLLDVLDDAVRH